MTMYFDENGRYITEAQALYDSLSPEAKEGCHVMKHIIENDGREAEWESIVRFQYERDNAMPAAWFKYWDD